MRQVFSSLSNQRLSMLALATCGALTAVSNASAGLVINSHFISSSPPPNIAGGGNLQDIFNVAAAAWERAFSDPHDTWVVDINFEWAPLGTTLGMFTLDSQGGIPHREQSGLITFNNSRILPLFADPTPSDNSEYNTYTEYSRDLGGGTINVGRIYTGATGDALDHFDLLQLAEHEIGHALGLLSDNIEFQKQIPGQTLSITSPRPDPGTTIFMFAGHIDLSFLPPPLMTSIGMESERKLISGVDILANAQLSTFNNPNLDPYSVPDSGAGTLGLAAFALAGLALVTKWLREETSPLS